MIQLISAIFIVMITSCSSGPEVKSQEYAKLKSEHTFDYGFAEVWKGIEKALAKNKIIERDPDDVNETELKKLTERTLETDWVNSRSNDKFISYKHNNLPKKKYLQVRFKYLVSAKSTLGGTHVSVQLKEQVEQLYPDGTPLAWVNTDEPDSARSNDLIEKIRLAILSSPDVSNPN